MGKTTEASPNLGYRSLAAVTWPVILGIALYAAAGMSRAESPASPAASTSGGDAVADPNATKPSPPFKDADKNGDHYITKDELQDYPRLLERFDEVDAGKDGKLEQHEYANLVEEKKRAGYR